MISREEDQTQRLSEKNQVGWVITYIGRWKQAEMTISGTSSSCIIARLRNGLPISEFSIAGNDYRIHYDEKGDYYYIEKVLIDDDDDDDGSSSKEKQS